MEIIAADKSHIDHFIRLNREVQQVHVDLFPAHYKTTEHDVLVKHYEAWMDEDNFRFYLAKENDEYVGYIICVIFIKPETPFSYAQSFIKIDQICVTESKRGKGIGKALINKAVELAKSLNIGTLETSYWTANERAGKVYRRYGFSTYCEKMSMHIDLGL